MQTSFNYITHNTLHQTFVNPTLNQKYKPLTKFTYNLPLFNHIKHKFIKLATFRKHKNHKLHKK